MEALKSNTNDKLLEVALRIREMREISGFSEKAMAEKTDTSIEEYRSLEAGETDFPFSFIHKCALAFGIEITDLLEGHSAHLSSYTVTRKGGGRQTAKEDGIDIRNLAPMFSKKIAEPYYVKYEYSDALQQKPIHCIKHAGQEFDLILEGQLKVQVGDNVEILSEGDSIYYNSSEPHGMIAVGGKDCTFLAVVLPGEDEEQDLTETIAVSARAVDEELICGKFISVTENERGALTAIDFKNEESFNFAFDVVDAVADKYPEKLAMIHIDKYLNEQRFTYLDMKKMSARCANYFKSLGIKKGDRVMLVLKRHYQFWISILALHKLGAIAIPATNLLQKHDFVYRFNAAGVSAIICTGDGDVANQVYLAEEESPTLKVKVIANGSREGWHNLDEEYPLFSSRFERTEDSASGSDYMLMLFTSGTTGYPKIAAHSYLYALGHYVTAKYWHGVKKGGLHFTISETGWGKALWGKLYGQWLCESAVFVYDFDKFDENKILPLMSKYRVTSFCAPPTMYRMLLRADLSKFDLSSIERATTAGEAMNPEVFKNIELQTGLKVMEGFGQTETTLVIANMFGSPYKTGSMGRPSPLYEVDLVDKDGNTVGVGETGEIVIHTDNKIPCGLFKGYYLNEENTKESWHDGLYHTGDVAWRDEDGFYWYVGRADDVIKSSGYRIGPFEIESVITELPYVVECGVSAAPDELRGQVVKASIVLAPGTEPSEPLKKEIQDYVKSHTAPYKYPRIIVFRDELPKTISGKIQRNLL